MPSLEILVPARVEECPIELDEYGFAILVSSPPVSHRKPSLWQKLFQRRRPAFLVHLGEERFKSQAEGWFFAFGLLDVTAKVTAYDRFRFKASYVQQAMDLIEQLLDCSNGVIYFTSDVQFGPKPQMRKRLLTLDQFRNLHDKSGLRFNTWIPISARSTIKTRSEGS